MRHWKKALLVVVGLLVLAPLALLTWVVTTESGLRFATGTLDRIGKVGPVTLQIRDVSGTLARGARFGHVEIRHRNADIVARDIEGRVRALPLLARRIDVISPRVGSIEVVAHEPGERRRPVNPKFLAPLMRLDVYDAAIDELRLTLANGTTHRATGIGGSVTILPKQMRIRDARGDLPELPASVRASGRLHARAPFAFDGQAEVDYTREGQPAWRIRGGFEGNLEQVDLNVELDEPFHGRVTGAARRLETGWRLDARAEVQDLDLETFGGGDTLGTIAGTLEVGADAEGFTARGTVDPAGLEAGPMEVSFSGQYRARRLEIREAGVHHPASGARATTSGEVVLREQGGPHIDLAGEWTGLRWPLAGAPPTFTSTRGRYSIAGDKPWQVTAAGLMEAGGLPATPFDVRGTLETGRFVIGGAQLDALQGQVHLTGEARWQPAQSWTVEGQARGLNPVELRADLPGRLDFNFTASGAPFGADGALAVSMTNLRGQLRGQPLSGRGAVARSAGAADFVFNDVDVRLGRTQLQLDGSIRPGARDLRFALNAEDLSLIDPDARGQVSARGRFAGTTQEPVLELTARGKDFEWRGVKVATLSADVDMDLGAGQRAGTRIRVEGLHASGRELQEASLVIDGTPAEHRITLDTLAKPVRMYLSAEGAVADRAWAGTIDALTLKDDQNLNLNLEQAVAASFSAGTAHLDLLCLMGEEARLCAGGQYAPAGWNVGFEASQLPLVALTAGLTTDVAYQGTINIKASARGAPDSDPTGELRAQLQDAVLEHQLSNGRVEQMSLGSGEVVAIATPDALDIDASLDAAESGNLTARLRIDRTVGEWRDHPVTGRLDMTTDGLGVLDVYLGGIDRASGRLTAKVDFGGTLGAPTVDGLIQLRNAQIDIFQINLSMRDLTMDARFDTNRLELEGSSAMGGETMRFSGNLAWRDREPYGELRISGENLLIVDVPEVTARASPDLRFAIEGRRVNVTGTVRLPRVDLEPADLTNAVLASSDEVMVGDVQVDPDMRWIVTSDIRVELGEEVHLDAFGLTARLGGALNVRGDQFGVTRGQGELGVVEGQYSAFGRRLDITRGRLIFNNTPLTDPGVDLRAEKVFPEVTAGVNVRGTLRTPRMTFYSEPSLPQWQIASLILAGGSLQAIQNSSARSAASAVLVAQGGAMLAQHFGSQLGIQDVSLETNLQNESSLVFGRYLTPRLYISYGISLAEAINTLRLRYTISDRWTLRIESGSAQSADLDFLILRGGAPPMTVKQAGEAAATPEPAP